MFHGTGRYGGIGLVVCRLLFFRSASVFGHRSSSSEANVKQRRCDSCVIAQIATVKSSTFLFFIKLHGQDMNNVVSHCCGILHENNNGLM